MDTKAKFKIDIRALGFPSITTEELQLCVQCCSLEGGSGVELWLWFATRYLSIWGCHRLKSLPIDLIVLLVKNVNFWGNYVASL